MDNVRVPGRPTEKKKIRLAEDKTCQRHKDGHAKETDQHTEEIDRWTEERLTSMIHRIQTNIIMLQLER